MKKLLAGLLLTCLLTTIPAFGAYAQVDTVESQTAENTVYIAGNPDLYPIEYYDSTEKVYKGIMPDLYEKISQFSGLNFTYICAGEKNQQSRLAKNNQAEVISAHVKGEIGSGYTEYPILTYESSEGPIEVCLCFTGVATESTVWAVTYGLKNLSDAELLSLSINEAASPTKQTNYLKFIIPIVVLLLVIAVLIAVIAKSKRDKKEKHQFQQVDSLTGIGNKLYFEETYRNWISESSYSLYYIAYISFDINHMRKYSGAEQAEQIQRYAAEVLSSGASDSDFTARINDGIFLLALQAPSQEQAEIRITELLYKLNHLYRPEESDYKATFRAGIFHLDSPGIPFETGYVNAEKGYNYAEKNNLPFCFSDRNLLNRENKNAQIQLRLLDAIKNDKVCIYFQYIVDAKNSKIAGAEVLSRLYTQENGLLKPISYIGQMIEAGFIDQHDFYILENVCKLLEKWSQTDKKHLWLSCNFTRHTISKENFIINFKKIISKYSFPKENLIIEITEDSQAKDMAIVYSNIIICKELGVRIALDDFGSGYTSLNDLCDYPVDIIKIDRHFVLKSLSGRGHSLLQGIINTAHDLDTMVLCEGIETAADDDNVKKANCDFIQGFYYSRVLPIEEADNYYKKYNSKSKK